MAIFMKTLVLTAAALVSTFASAADTASPAGVFDLQNWKLQIPGPKEVRQLTGYSCDYFSLNENREMVFKLDAAEKGTTPNTDTSVPNCAIFRNGA